MNWQSVYSEKRLRKKLFVLQYISINIDQVKIFCVLHDKVALLTRRCSEQATRNRDQINFRKVLIPTSFNHK